MQISHEGLTATKAVHANQYNFFLTLACSLTFVCGSPQSCVRLSHIKNKASVRCASFRYPLICPFTFSSLNHYLRYPSLIRYHQFCYPLYTY